MRFLLILFILSLVLLPCSLATFGWVKNLTVSDAFTDGDYTSNPAWTVGNGVWAVANTNLSCASGTTNGFIYQHNIGPFFNSTAYAMRIDTFFTCHANPGTTGWCRVLSFAGSTNVQDALSGYVVFVHPRDTNCLFELRKADGAGALTSIFPGGPVLTCDNNCRTKIVNLSVQRDANGKITVYCDGNYYANYTDKTYGNAVLDGVQMRGIEGGADYLSIDNIEVFKWSEAAPAVTPVLSFWVANETKSVKALFKEGEEFRIFANHTLSNGSVLAGSNCTQKLWNASIENDGEQSFTLCGSGCDYSTYRNTTVNVSKVSVTHDTIHFSVCNQQSSVGTITVSFCGVPAASITSGSISSCAVGDSSITINSTSCITKNYVKYNISFSGPNSQRKLVTKMAADRFYSVKTEQMLYNATAKTYKDTVGNEYYAHGAKTYNVTCRNNGWSMSGTAVFTVVNAPPYVRFSSVLNPMGNFSAGQKIEYAAGNWSWFISINDDDLDFFRIIWKNSSRNLYNITSKTVRSFYNTLGGVFVRNQQYNLSIWANDSFKNSTYRSFKFNMTDTHIPVCAPLVNGSVLNGTFFSWNVTCADEYFFSFNATCDNGFSYYKKNIGNTSWRFENKTFVEEPGVNCFFKYCDGHTVASIAEMEVKTDILKEGGRSLAFNSVSISAENVAAWTTEKKRDRYAFCAELSEPSDTVSFIIPEGCYPARASPWKGHLVCPISGLWWDFEGNNAKVTIEGGMVKAVFEERVKSACFSSVGKFNCVNESQFIEGFLLPVPPKVRFESTAEALWFFFITFLWLVFLFGAIVLRGSHNKPILVLALFQMVIGVFLGLQLISVFRLLLIGYTICLTAVAFLVGLTFTNWES